MKFLIIVTSSGISKRFKSARGIFGFLSRITSILSSAFSIFNLLYMDLRISTSLEKLEASLYVLARIPTGIFFAISSAALCSSLLTEFSNMFKSRFAFNCNNSLSFCLVQILSNVKNIQLPFLVHRF